MYIKKSLYGGLNYKDAKEVISQLEWDGRFDVPADAVEACILSDIMVRFPQADKEKIRDALEGNRKYKFHIPSTNDGIVASPDEPEERWPNWVEISGYQVSEQYLFGQVFYETAYDVEDITEENVCYIPREQFYAMFKGIPLIERFYHEPFSRYDEAVAFLESMEKHDPKSEVVILVHDRSKIMETDWYKANMKVVEELRSHPEKKDRFAIPVSVHLGLLGIKTWQGKS